MLGHREEVRQDLRGMELVREAVPDGNTSVLGQFLHGRLREAAVLDAVEHPAQHPGGVLHGFLDADLRARGAEIGHVRTLVIGRHFEGAAGPGGRLFENEGDVLARERLALRTGLLGLLEGAGEVQQIPDFLRGKVEQFQETAVFQVDSHIH